MLVFSLLNIKQETRVSCRTDRFCIVGSTRSVWIYENSTLSILFLDDNKMTISNQISTHFNLTYQYLTSPETHLVSDYPWVFCIVMSLFFEIFGDHVETTVVGFFLSIVVAVLYYLIRRSQSKARCKYLRVCS